MAADTTKKAGSQPAEAYIVMEAGGYSGRLAIPARLASVILPELIHMETDYKDGKDCYKLTGSQLSIVLLDAPTMAAAQLAKRLEGQTT